MLVNKLWCIYYLDIYESTLGLAVAYLLHLLLAYNVNVA